MGSEAYYIKFVCPLLALEWRLPACVAPVQCSTRPPGLCGCSFLCSLDRQPCHRRRSVCSLHLGMPPHAPFRHLTMPLAACHRRRDARAQAAPATSPPPAHPPSHTAMKPHTHTRHVKQASSSELSGISQRLCASRRQVQKGCSRHAYHRG